MNKEEYLNLIKSYYDQDQIDYEEEAQKRLDRMREKQLNYSVDISNVIGNDYMDFIDNSRLELLNFTIQISHVKDKYVLMIWEQVGTEEKPFVKKVKVLYDKRFSNKPFKLKFKSDHTSLPLTKEEVKDILVWIKIIAKLNVFI